MRLSCRLDHLVRDDMISRVTKANMRQPHLPPWAGAASDTHCPPPATQLPWRLRTMASVAEVCGKETPHEVSEALAECAAECRGGEACRMALDVLLPYLKRFDTPESLLEVAVWAAGEFASQTGLPGASLRLGQGW